jgi:hypothetical protein
MPSRNRLGSAALKGTSEMGAWTSRTPLKTKPNLAAFKAVTTYP